MPETAPEPPEVPIRRAEASDLAAVKARLRLLNALAEPDLVEKERRRLAAERDADAQDEPR